MYHFPPRAPGENDTAEWKTDQSGRTDGVSEFQPDMMLV
jgi:hypothetical protein